MKFLHSDIGQLYLDDYVDNCLNEDDPDKIIDYKIGHRKRLKDRLMKSALGELPDYEILELILCGVYKQGDMKELAKSLLSTRTLAQLLSTDKEVLMQIKGIGESVIAMLRVIREAACRLIANDSFKKPIFESWFDVIDYCRAAMAHLSREMFRVFYLNKSHYLIEEDIQDAGTIDKTSIYPREIIKKALLLDASSIIMAHNHPSGNLEPSNADIRVTKIVQRGLQLFDIALHDHLIIGSTGFYSFKTKGLI